MTCHCYHSPQCSLLIECDGQGLVRLSPTETYQSTDNDTDNPHLTQVTQWLDTYFAGRPPTTFPSFHLQGTPFQLRVWRLLLTIPYGHTTTYGALARLISPTMSAQAIGQAVHHNPCCIIIPCHRVIGSNHSLTGYAYGLTMKEALLRHEKTDRSTHILKVP
ncbi:MAG: methylated-DNA--[protein]-cysteine S-methyltransferase [Bacteroidales bacterium]|nr:methylated-DNA--[protein]-cysteine S-methyltransferase [Bacteroidales bacterium]